MVDGGINKSTKFYVEESDDSQIKLQSIGNDARQSVHSRSPKSSSRAMNAGPAVRKGKSAVMDGVS